MMTDDKAEARQERIDQALTMFSSHRKRFSDVQGFSINTTGDTHRLSAEILTQGKKDPKRRLECEEQVLGTIQKLFAPEAELVANAANTGYCLEFSSLEALEAAAGNLDAYCAANPGLIGSGGRLQGH